MGFVGSERYEVIRPLASGGMGAVYFVYDKRREKNLALKILRDPERNSLYRFKREFRATADLVHPNLVRLYDLGSLPDGVFFYTMEYIDGVSIADFVASASGEPDATTAKIKRVLIGVLEGLSFLHSARIVHRDLKPANILVENETGRPRLLDFGILRELDSPTGMTHSQVIVGTPRYMSPEQAKGTPVTQASDLYSFGCVLYELLTGQPVFLGSTGEVLQQHISSTPKKPSELRACDKELEALCARLMQKAPEARPTAQEALRMLRKEEAAPRAAAVFPVPLVGLLGREAELRFLETERLASRHAPRLLLLGAESGAGKSALLSEFSVLAQERGASVWWGRCYEREDVSYKAFDAVVDALAVTLLQREALDDATGSGLRALVRLFPVLGEVRALRRQLSEASIVDPLLERHHAWRSLFQLLKAFSGGEPAVLLIEDLHWADAGTFDILHWFVKTQDLPPCLIVATYQQKEGASDPRILPLQEAGPCVVSHQLAPLAPEAISLLIDAYAPILKPEEGELIVREARGNPLLAIELARSYQEGRAQSDHLSLRTLLARRFAMLSEGAREVLAVISVAASRVGFSLLREASGLHSASLAEALDELLRCGLLRELSLVQGEESYELLHEPLRVAAYEALTEERRRALHSSLAQLLMSQDDPARAVEHWRRAGEKERASSAAMAAGEDAEAKLAFEDAARLYSLAAQEGSFDAKMAQGRVLKKAGHHRLAAQAFTEASQSAPEALANEAKLCAVTERFSAGEIQSGLEGLQELLSVFGASLSRSRLVRLLSTLGNLIVCVLYWWVSDLFHRSQRLSQKRPPTEREAFLLRFYDAIQHHLLSSNPLVAAHLGTRHARLALRIGDPLHISRARLAHSMRAGAAFGSRLAASTLNHIYSGEALCTSIGDARGLLDAQYSRGILHLFEGNSTGAKEAVVNAEAITRRFGLFGEPSLMELRSFHVGAEYLGGNINAAIEYSKVYLADAKARGNVIEQGDPLVVLGVSWLTQGNAGAGKKAIEEGLAITPEAPLTLLRLRVEIMALELEGFESNPDKGFQKLADLRARWIQSEIFASGMEFALFGLQVKKMGLLWRRIKKTEPPRIKPRPITASARALHPYFQNEDLRLSAAYAMFEGRLWDAMTLIQKSMSYAERSNNSMAMGLAQSARATLRKKLGLLGAEHDQECARRTLQSLGILGCYQIALEGWEDPTL